MNDSDLLDQREQHNTTDLENGSPSPAPSPSQTNSTRSNRPSVGMRYGDMRNQLQQAAILRAQRNPTTKAGPSSSAPSNNAQGYQLGGNNSSDEATVDLDQASEVASARGDNRDLENQNANGFAQELDYHYDPADFEGQNYSPPPPSSHNQRENRIQRIESQGQTWKSIFGEPTDQWGARKCQLYCIMVACVISLFAEKPNCGIPLGPWLSGQFMFQILEQLTLELRQRMHNSVYWAEYRARKRWLLVGVIGSKELGEYSWQIYGLTLYFSDASDGCSDENYGFMFVFVMFLVLAIIKIVLIALVISILCFALCQRRLRRHNQRSASKDILRSLGRIKYSALSLAQNETDEECSICFCEYTEEDIVTKLDCNEKHVFHEQCISHWISQGENSCPLCRAPINSEIQL